MKECCKETHKKTIENILFVIRNSAKPETVKEIINGLEYAISMLKKDKPIQ